MEEEPTKTNQLPQKIALKVPSLFIQGTSKKSKDEDVKDKVEVSKPTDGTNNGSQNEASGNATKPNRRPMPAFAKRKLEQKKTKELELTDKIPKKNDLEEQLPLHNESTSVETPPETSSPTNKTPAPKPKSRAMPASARRKLEADKAEDTTAVSGDNHEPKDDMTDNIKLESSAEPTKIKSPSKAVPASVRRKLEESQKRSVKTETNEPTKANNEDTIKSSDFSHEDGKSKETPVETVKESKTISLAIGGIKFPTFTKPKPAPTRHKYKTLPDSPPTSQHSEGVIEEEESKSPESSNLDLSSTGEYNENKFTERSTRRSNSSAWISLHDDKHTCELCGAEFYNQSGLKSHHDAVHLGIKKIKLSKPKSTKTLGINICRHCGEEFKKIGNQYKKKFIKHVRQCTPLNFACNMCDKKFVSEKLLTIHQNSKVHAKTNNQGLPQSPSFHKADSKSSKNSAVSVSSNNTTTGGDRVNGDELSSPDTLVKKAAGPGSFKRKIASVLSRLQQNDSLRKKMKLETENDDSKDSQSKAVVSKNPGNTKCRPMPASIRKKLENRDAKSTESYTEPEPEPTTTTTEVVSSLDDYTCEVCYRIFTLKNNRKRHEVTVHGILDAKHERPKGKLFPRTSQVQINNDEKISTKKTEVKSIKSENQSSKNNTQSTITIKSAGPGKCPICKMSRSKVRKHLMTVHKITFDRIVVLNKLSNKTPTPSSPPIPLKKPTAPKSYKIYKSAAKKAKQRLANKNPDVDDKDLETPQSSRKLASPPRPPTPEEPEPDFCEDPVKLESDVDEGLAEPPEVPKSVQHHMQMKTVKKKKIITCKICSHLFSHEDDFIVHMKFKHKDMISTVQKSETESKVISKKSVSSTSKNTPSALPTPTPYVKGRVTRNSSQPNIPAPVSKPKERVPRIVISALDKELAENAKIPANTSNMNTRSTRSRSNNPPSPEPEPMDTYYDSDHNDDQVEFDPIDEIEIVSTFSQKPTVETKAPKLDEMPCSNCSEVFYSYEALRKHELYFHNVKTTKMCPICGVYPTRLSRHLMAHENKTVRCSCAPCRLNFDDFSMLLKHNIEKHPGPNGGAMCAPNKSLFVDTENSGIDTPPKESPNEASTSSSFRCAICYRTCSSAAQVRRHVRRVHAELGDNAENYVEEVNEPNESENVGSAVSDEAKPNITTSSETIVSQIKSKPGPASKKKIVKFEETSTVSSESSSAKKEVKPKPMPASVRAKLAKQAEAEASEAVTVKDKPMPASVRAKLAKQEEASVVSPESHSVPSKPVRPMPASARAKLESQQQSSINDDPIKVKSSKPSRPMPASARAKLEAQKGKPVISDSESNVSNSSRPMSTSAKSQLSNESPAPSKSVKKMKFHIPMPASIRAKMAKDTPENVPNLDDAPTPSPKSDLDVKTRRPGPASVKAKLALQNATPPAAASGSNSASAKPYRAGPASMKAKNKSKDETIEQEVTKPVIRPGRPMPASVRAKLNASGADSDSDVESKRGKRRKQDEDPDFEPNDSDDAQADDDADDVHMDVIEVPSDDDVQIIEDEIVEEPVEAAPSVPTFSIADEIAEHNQVLMVTRQSSSSNLSTVYQCKLCNKKFNSDDSTRKHIQRVHSEYGPDHTENLIEEIHDTYESGRPRRSTVRYVEDYVEEPDEDECIIPRGTSSRPRAGKKVWSPDDYSSPARKEESGLNYACKICNKQLNTSGNVKRHIGRAHRHLVAPYDRYVTVLGPDTDNTVEDNTWTPSSHGGNKPFQPSFNCPYCTESFDSTQALTLHLAAEHSNTEVINADEPEISMDEMAGMGEISISTTTHIKLDHPKPVVLSRRGSVASDHGNDEITEAHDDSNPLDEADPIDDAEELSEPVPVSEGEEEQMDTNPDPEPVEEEEDSGPAGFTYQADLSSLFPSLKNADGGLNAINHFEEGMSLD